jgi:predicted GTPase
MTYGAGWISATKFGAAEIVDPRPYAVGSIQQTYLQYPKLGSVLPAMGYSEEQIMDLEATANAAACDLVIFATPINLTRIVKLSKPAVRVRYEYKDASSPTLEEVLKQKVSALLEHR